MCISKTEGIPEYIVESISVINDKQLPQDGYCLISQTIDSGKNFIFELKKKRGEKPLASKVLLKNVLVHISFVRQTLLDGSGNFN